MTRVAIPVCLLRACLLRVCLLACAAVFAGSGCAGGPTVRARVQHPAAIPLRTFPVVWLAVGADAREQQLAEALAAHLRGPERQVDLVQRNDLEQRRLAGAIPAASVVVLLELQLRQGTITRPTTRPETICGSAGCFTRHRTDYFDVPTLRVRVRLTVFEGPTARILQRHTESAQDEGRRPAQMVERALQDLRERLFLLVDQRVQELEVGLLDADVPGVSDALLAIERGDWREGRVRLERVLETGDFAAADAETQARVLYDLGVARRFDPVSREGDLARHFEAAEEALRRAVRLDPRPRYDRALREAGADRARMQAVAAQRDAAQHNYQLGPSAVPPGYSAAPPAAPPAAP